MLKRTKFYILLALIVVTGLASGVSTNTLKGKERNFAVNHLKKSKDGVLKSVKHLSDAQLNFKPSTNSWSIKECLQHIALSESELWKWADGVLKEPVNPEKRSEIKITDNQLIAMITDRSKKAEAVEALQPANAKWKNVDDIVDAFKEERGKLIKYTKTTTEDVRSHITQGQLGYLDAYHIIIIISAHSVRHTKQIEEIKGHPNFPK